MPTQDAAIAIDNAYFLGKGLNGELKCNWCFIVNDKFKVDIE